MSSVAATATEDTPVTFAAADLLGNDSDVDGDSLSIASVTSGTGGTAVLNADGTVTFTPDAVAATEDTPVTFAAADLLGNDSDVDGDSLSIASVTSGTGGTAVLNADGTVTFTPDVAATEDTPVTFAAADLLGNDSDVDGDSLSIASVTSGTGGTAVLNADGTVTFTPDGVVHRRDRQGQGRGVGQAAVGDGVVHRVDAVEVGRRRVGVAAVGGDHDAAALGGGRCRWPAG
ncbi:cadherin-like domain-containing protein [Pseudomonas stutzeri]|nr:cadherin-like domain-containing protein [Stutzerimonas stutzeri]